MIWVRAVLRSAQRDVLQVEGRFLAALGDDGEHLRTLLRRLPDEPPTS